MQPAQREMGRFHSLTYWNHDTDPVSTDSVRRAVAWLPLASQVRTCTALSSAVMMLSCHQCIRSAAAVWQGVQS